MIKERQSGTSEVTSRNEAQAVDEKLYLFNQFLNIYFTKLLTKTNKCGPTHII